MPIYEYACAKCGKVFEELVFSAADEAVVVCPACGAGEPRRCLSACAPTRQFISGESGGAGAQASGGGCAAPSPSGFR